MSFQFHLDILDWIFKGMLIGIVASAPMGPVGVLCIQRTLNKGRWYGFITGIGATVSDFIYALITGFGMSFVMDLINNNHNRFILQITGSIMLMAFGIFLVTFSNPLIIFLFMAAFAQFAFVIPKHPLHMCVGYLSIICGALLWWFGLTWLIDKVRGKFDNGSIVIINKIIGSIVMIFSLIVLIGTVFNLYTFHY